MILYCATGNAHKLKEFQEAAGDGIEIRPVPGFRDVPPCEETGATFEENAVLKAEYYGRGVEGLVFADDSGLEVDALGGAPGVYSARYAGEGATDGANNQLLLTNLRGVEDRTARFVCVIALVRDGRLSGTYRGAVEGRIIDAERGPNGFGYDPMFFYPPFRCTFGEASSERKWGVSHRGQAFRRMMAALRGK